MKIKTRLSIQFAIIVASILILFSLSIYYFSSEYRENDFFDRLKNRAMSTAKLLVSVKEVDAGLLQIIDKNTPVLFDEEVSIFSLNGEKIYCSSGSLANNRNNLEKSIINQLSNNKELFFEQSERAFYVSIYEADNRKFYVMASAYDKFGYSKLANLRVILILGLSISIIITIIAGLFYSDRAMKPIMHVIHQVKNITASNLNLRVSEGNGKDEIAELAITFNEMLARLESSFDLQKSFVSNASHEFRTPLTLILGEIELLLMHDRSIEEYKDALKSIDEEVKSLNKLSSDLLDLAQLSTGSGHIKFEEVRLDELFFEIIENKRKKYSEIKIQIDFEESPDKFEWFTILGHTQLLKTAFTNLINNALKFSDNKPVMITIGFKNQLISIAVKDNGIGIPSEDIDKIFQPFYRAKNSKEKQGKGLGLSLTEKIITLHNGTITVSSKENEGSTFIVQLPTIGNNI